MELLIEKHLKEDLEKEEIEKRMKKIKYVQTKKDRFSNIFVKLRKNELDLNSRMKNI